MTNIVTPEARTLLVQSLHAVGAREDEMRASLAAALARSDQDPELSDTPEAVAAVLLRFLIEQVSHVLGGGEPRDLALHRREHRLNGVVGRHYSRFGDALVPVLRDVLGPTYPRATAAAWCDAFWSLVQRMQESGEPASRPAMAPQRAEAVA